VPLGYIGAASQAPVPHTSIPEILSPMPVETLEFLLLLSGWITAFLLGRELQTGFRQWRMRTVEQRPPRKDR
jgi:hypothetical protein